LNAWHCISDTLSLVGSYIYDTLVLAEQKITKKVLVVVEADSDKEALIKVFNIALAGILLSYVTEKEKQKDCK
jgi:hypothetical protein